MKALIISEDENVYSTLDEILKNASYDTIIYKWLLKALDNIEEIRPNLIVVSSSEYPRHWKTLVQFVKSGIGGDDVEIYLYEPTPVSDEDQEKARVLGVTGCFSEFDEFSKMVLRQAQEAQEIIVDEPSAAPGSEQTVVPELVEGPEPNEVAEPTVVPEQTVVPKLVEGPEQEEVPLVENTQTSSQETAVTNTGHFMFTHPSTQKFISGKYFDYNGNTLSCSFFDEADLSSVKEEMLIESFSFFDSIKVRTASVIVKNIMSLAPSNTFVIVEIKDIYEEN